MGRRAFLRYVQRPSVRARFNELAAPIERHPVWALGAALAVFLITNSFWCDVSLFGSFHDDTLYFGSAKALAQGRGYVIPSLPGAPAQTKYPILYPCFLSLIWRADPDFPGNVRWAFLLNVLFGAVFVSGCYALVRSLGHRVIVAVSISVACALQPMTQLLTAAVLSDIPFMAFSIWAIALSANWLEEEAGPRRGRGVTAVTILVALAILTRVIGVGLALGIIVAAAKQQKWKKALALAIVSGGVAAMSLGWAQAYERSPVGLTIAEAGYRQTLLFYTDYAGFWREGVPDSGLLGAMVLRNSAVGILEIGVMVFGGLWRPWGAPLILLPMLLGVAIIWRIFGAGRGCRQPVHFVFLIFGAIVALWNYPLAGRLFLLFLPLFLVGAYRLVKWAGKAFLRAIRSADLAERIVGTAGMTALAVLALMAAYSHLWHSPLAFAKMRAERRPLLQDRLMAYSWIAENTPPDARIMSYEDGLLYLYTGRQGIRPLQITSAPSYDPDGHPVAAEAARMLDVASALKADYWLFSEGDWSAEEEAMVERLRSAELRAVEGCPVVAKFGSSAVLRQMNKGQCEGKGR